MMSWCNTKKTLWQIVTNSSCFAWILQFVLKFITIFIRNVEMPNFKAILSDKLYLPQTKNQPEMIVLRLW